jgi:hypothetical protein
MPFPQHESELKALAAHRIRQDLLPSQLPKCVWAGQGSGKPCSLCDQAIDKTETEYELDVPAGRANAVVRLHLRCHTLWQLELARLSE